MKSLLRVLAFFTAVIGVAASPVQFSVPAPVEPTDEEVLRSIADIETGNDPAVIGRYRERTRYQFREMTWRRYSSVPHYLARTRHAEVERVARAYLADIRKKLRERGVEATPYYIAVSWNAGLNWSSIPASTQDYAQRVCNLVESRVQVRKESLASSARKAAPSVRTFTIEDRAPVAFTTTPSARAIFVIETPAEAKQRILLGKPLLALALN